MLAITFTEYGNRNIKGNGFGGDFLLKNGFDIIAVKTIENRWYVDFLSKGATLITSFLSSTTGHHRWRCGYGSSMGGYAAIKFSGLFDLNCVLAISPQFDISQDWDPQWRQSADPSLEWPAVRTTDLAKECKYFIAYDPYDKDNLHYRQYCEVIPASQMFPLRVPMSGHPSGYVLQETGSLRATVLAPLAGRGQDPDWRILVRAGRHKSGRYFHNLAAACLSHRKLNWAESASKRALALNAFHPEYNIRLALIYDLKGDLDGMFAAAAAAVAANPWHPHMAALLARALSRKGMKKEAFYQVDRACSLSKDMSFLKLKEDIEKS